MLRVLGLGYGLGFRAYLHYQSMSIIAFFFWKVCKAFHESPETLHLRLGGVFPTRNHALALGAEELPGLL